MTASEQDLIWLQRAIGLAERGLYTTDPNPRVGCVIVKEDQAIAEGWHQYVGGPHAEVYALQQAGALAQDAVAYVSLEPCVHHGHTGSCADALIDAGIQRVVAAMIDPYPKVAGRGFARLAAAGLEVVRDCLPAAADRLNPGYYKRLRTGLPWVRLKMAATLDGRTATATGASQWLTGADARSDVQHWRARSSAIITGSGTVLQDNPALTVREQKFAGADPAWPAGLRQPLRVVLDRRCRLTSDARVFTGVGNSLWFTETPVKAAVESNHMLAKHWPLESVLRALAERECNEVLVEAGPKLAGAFVEQGLVDEFIFYLAPALLGADANPMFMLPGIQQLADRILLELCDISPIGQDLRIIAKLRQ